MELSLRLRCTHYSRSVGQLREHCELKYCLKFRGFGLFIETGSHCFALTDLETVVYSQAES